MEKIGNVVLDLSRYPGEDFYCDGAVEDEILEIVKKHSEEEFNDIIFEHKSWPVLYHLSHIRANIIQSVPISKEDTVLEIGAGCGAITGKLSEKAKKVTCIELSKKRSMINAYRNKDKQNIEILVGNFQDIEKDLTEKYDYITLIGVFEYGESYINSEADSDPYLEFLKTVAAHLKPNGKIIMAIENKYGMKYYAGCKEDHVSRYFEGVEGYSETSGVKTFYKEKLLEYAKKSGVGDVTFYYPYPDYKFPEVIFSDEYLPQKGELGNYSTYNFDNDRMILFNEVKAFDNAIEDGLFTHYSNSYLLVMSKGQ